MLGLKPSNVYTSRFVKKLEVICGFALIGYNFRKLSPETVRQGQALVKTALYHIRRRLKTGKIWDVCLDDRTIVQHFATTKNVDELFNLGGFPTFWSNKDRGLRMVVMGKLAELVTEKDLPRLKDFKKKLEEIQYQEHEDYDFEFGRSSTFGGKEWNRMDRNDFAKMMARATSPASQQSAS